MALKISVTEKPRAKDLMAIEEGLYASTTDPDVPPRDQKPLAIFLKDEDQQLVGGLVGSTLFQWLHIKHLWIHADYQGKDHGTALVKRAEKVAAERGCKYVWLDTFSFQARAFYEKLGFEVFGTLNDFPPGYQKFFLKRTLVGTDAKIAPKETEAKTESSPESASEGKLRKVWLYTDGGCSPNPGPGGWAAVLKCPAMKMEKELYGYVADSTNNRMELTAIIKGLEALKSACEIKVVTDSQYVANAFTNNWLKGWKRKGWKTASKSPVKNKDLWIALDALVQKHHVSWEWVRGHTGHDENERCDELVHLARRKKLPFNENA